MAPQALFLAAHSCSARPPARGSLGHAFYEISTSDIGRNDPPFSLTSLFFTMLIPRSASLSPLQVTVRRGIADPAFSGARQGRPRRPMPQDCMRMSLREVRGRDKEVGT